MNIYCTIYCTIYANDKVALFLDSPLLPRNIKPLIRNSICKPERTPIGVYRLYLRVSDSHILNTSGTGSSRTKNNNDKF